MIQFVGAPAMAERTTDLDLRKLAEEIFDVAASVKTAKEFLKDVPNRFLEQIWQLRMKTVLQAVSKNIKQQTLSILVIEKGDITQKKANARNETEKQLYENFEFLIRTSLRVLQAMINNEKEQKQQDSDDFSNQENDYKALLSLSFYQVYEVLKQTSPKHAYFFLMSMFVDFSMIAILGMKSAEIDENRLQLISDFMVHVSQRYGGAAMGLGLISKEMDSDKLQRFLTEKK